MGRRAGAVGRSPAEAKKKGGIASRKRPRKKRRRTRSPRLEGDSASSPTLDVENALFSAVNEDGVLEPRLIVVAGDLELPFDEVETLKVLTSAAAPLAMADKKLKETLDLQTRRSRRRSGIRRRWRRASVYACARHGPKQTACSRPITSTCTHAGCCWSSADIKSASSRAPRGSERCSTTQWRTNPPDLPARRAQGEAAAVFEVFRAPHRRSLAAAGPERIASGRPPRARPRAHHRRPAER